MAEELNDESNSPNAYSATPLPPGVGDAAPAVLTLPSAQEEVYASTPLASVQRLTAALLRSKYLPVDPLDYFDEVEMLQMEEGEISFAAV